ncbi:MAG: relaxase domain-containing protein [Acidimicrobiia bacterium]|nr:relaxase domain-containing protein [Acidimicrobiia bacterium]
MALSIAKIDVGHARYYTSQPGRLRGEVGTPVAGGGAGSPSRASGGGGAGSAAAYYADGPEQAGRWVSAGGMGVVVGSAVTYEEMVMLLSGADPSTGEKLGQPYKTQGWYTDRLGVRRRRKSLSAFDTTFSVPKSLSVAWALADDDIRKQIEMAFDEAVEAVVDYIQDNAIVSRKGKGGREEIATEGATVARFDHTTSRAGDPQLHAHILWANRVKCIDGKWRTLFGRKLYAHAKAASLVGGSVLRTAVSQRLSWSWDRIGENEHAELSGVPSEIAARWSQRRRAVERDATRRVQEFIERNGREPTIDERAMLWDRAAVETRDKKSKTVDPDPHAGWRAEAAEVGIDADEMIAALGSAQRLEPALYDRPEILVQTAPDPEFSKRLVAVAEGYAIGLTGAQLDEVAYSTINAEASAAAATSGHTAAGVVHHRADQLRDALHGHLVHADGKWWSPGVMAAETAVMSWFSTDTALRLTASTLDLEGLTDDQASAVAELAAATTNGLILVGPAGTGKTTALKRLCDAFGSERVVAAAPTAVAAASLGQSLEVRGETVAKVLVSDDPLPEGGLVIVDEAGQLSTRDLAALCGRAAAAGARVLMVGDPAQQNSVSAGGLFDALARSNKGCVTNLHQLKRFTDPNEAAATVLIRSGNIKGLDYHLEAGRISELAASEIAVAAADWWEQRTASSTVIAAPTRTMTNEINVEIAQRRAAAGETGKAVAGSGDSTIRKGDLIATRRNNRKLVASDGQWVRNGDRWIVTGGRGGKIKARREDGKATIELPADYAASEVQLGYSITTTRAQSLTVDAGLCIVTANSNLPQLYVGLTRGRAENSLLVVTDQPSFDPDAPPDHVPSDEILKNIFDRRLGWRTSVDPRNAPAPTQPAAQYLQLLPTIDHTTPLPAMPGLDVAAHVAQRGTFHDDAALADRFEADIDADIDAWLIAEHEIELDYGGPTEEDWQWYEQHTPPDADQPLPVDASIDHAAWDRDDGQWAGVDQWTEPTYEDWVAPAGTDPAEDDEDSRWDAYIAAAERREPVLAAADAGSDSLPDFIALAQRVDMANLVYAASAEFDNPWLTQLVHKRSTAQPGDPAAPALLALIAAVADRPLREAIRSTHKLPPVNAGDLDWARSVRSAVLSNRATRFHTVLEQFQALHDTEFARLEQHDDPAYAAAATTARADLDEAILRWLDDGATGLDFRAVRGAVRRDMADNALSGQPITPARTAPETPTWRELATLDHTPAAPDNTLAAVSSLAPAPQAAGRRPSTPNQLTEAVGAAADYYHQQLLGPKGEKARRYLLSRGIGPDEWAKWNIGWASGTPQMAALLGEDTAVDTGLARRPNDGQQRDHLRYRITLPIADDAGNVISIAGRTLSKNPDVPKYINTTNTAVYDKSAALYGLDRAAESIRSQGGATIVEGYLDVIAAHRAGLTNTVASCGTAITGGHLSTLAGIGSPPVVTVMLDSDSGGRPATASLLDTADQLGWAAKAVFLPEGADPDDLAADELRHHASRALPNPWAAVALAAAGACDDLVPGQPPSVHDLNRAYTDVVKWDSANDLAAADHEHVADCLIAAHETSIALNFGVHGFREAAAALATPDPSPELHTPDQHTGIDPTL